MHKTPKAVFERLLVERPSCERAAYFHDHACSGRSTFEHAWLYGGRQIPDAFAVIRLCELAHSVGSFAMNGILDKEKNRYLSLRHATDADLKKYPKIDWMQIKKHLSKKYEKHLSRRGVTRAIGPA
jgi:hypothetical protein